MNEQKARDSEHAWDKETIYVSNEGRGPLRARVLDVNQRRARLERWDKKSPNRRTLFSLPAWFLWEAEACGWRER